MHLPISLVVPAYNESRSIVTSIKALLQLEYPDFEVVVVNDGSTDDTLEKLISGFQLYPYPEAYRKQVPCRQVRATYRSARYRNLRVVDKENGGSKADAANAGINICRNPLVAIVDADGVLQRDSLRARYGPFSRIRKQSRQAALSASPTAARCATVSSRRWRCREIRWHSCRSSSTCVRFSSVAWDGSRSAPS